MFYTLALKSEKGCPVFIDGILKESFYPGIYNESMSGTWYYAEPGEQLASLPENLVLITKDKDYNFDFRTGLDGHFVSEHFLKVLKELKISNWEFSSLDIVNPKGEKATQKKYYYMRQVMQEQKKQNVIDTERSKINFRKNGEIKNITSLAIKETVALDIFEIFEISLLGYIFISSRAAKKFEQENFKGFEIVGTEEIGSVECA